MKTILVVCTANICRSPMATALLRQRIARLGLADQITVRSAGVWAREGLGASPPAVEVLAERDVILGEHRSQPVTPALLEDADIILAMEEGHRRSLFYMAPQHLGKIFLMTEMAGGHDDVSDPYGGSREDYEHTVDLLQHLIDAGLPGVLKRLGVKKPGAGAAAN